MLPAAHRLRSAADFQRTIRGGSRAAFSTVVVHALFRGEDQPYRVGLAVNKTVGNSVARHSVSRKIRAACANAHIADGWDLVIRALPGAATSPTLAADVQRGVEKMTSSHE